MNNKIHPRTFDDKKPKNNSFLDNLYFQSLRYAYLHDKKIILPINYKFYLYLFQIYLVHPSLLYNKIKYKLS